MRKMSKQTMSIALCLALTVFNIGIPFSTHSAARAKLAKTKFSMTIGQKKKISIKGRKSKAKYTFSSSAKTIAAVSKKGIVTAKKKGTVKISVKEKYKKKTRKLGTVTIKIKKKASVKTDSPVTTPNITNSPAATATITSTATATPTTTPTAAPSATPSPSPKITPTPYVEDPDMVVPAGALNKNGPTGTTEVFTYDSTAVAEGKTVSRQALVALPPGYKSTKTYPVVYGLHGYGWGIYNLAQDGAVNVAWNGYANDSMEQVIMVFPNICANESGVGQGHDQATYDAYDNCVNDIVDCLMPAIEKKYAVKKGRKNTAVWGFSMGGREALNLGFKHPELFGAIGAFCPAPGVLPYTAEKGIFTEDTFKLPDEYKNDTLVLIVKGVNDSMVGDNPILYHNVLTKNETPHIYYATMGGDEKNRGGGGHQDVVYLHGLYNLMKRAFPCN